jgi:hypothetical protein
MKTRKSKEAAEDHTPHLRLRIDPRLLARLEKSREKAGRTLTGEIVHRLEQSFLKDDTLEQAENVATRTAKQILYELYGKVPVLDELVKERLEANRNPENTSTESSAVDRRGVRRYLAD